jgi:hypothetical protein
MRSLFAQEAGRLAAAGTGPAPGHTGAHLVQPGGDARAGPDGRRADHKTLIHSELGAIEVDCQALFTEDQSQPLLVLTAPPRSEGYEKLRLLAVLGHERFAQTASS